jgi:hypothetical protein
MGQRIEEVYPELFHYTGFAGLQGILQSQELWGTNARFLNDDAELMEFRDYLRELMRPAVARIISKKHQLQTHLRALIERQGGISGSIDEVVTTAVNEMFTATFGSAGKAGFSDAYIVSFCTPATERQGKHGLLSQWRGYGVEGGYAIVFDTPQLSAAMDAESKRWGGSNVLVFGGDIVYSDAGVEGIITEFPEQIETIVGGFAGFFDSGDQRHLDPVLTNLLVVSCRFKHWGFSEEREVRIVTIPPNDLIVEEMKRRGNNSPLMPIHTRQGRDGAVPTVHLFDDYRAAGKRLPIRRIIVGPGGDTMARRQQVIELLQAQGFEVPVTISEIPYVERSV